MIKIRTAILLVLMAFIMLLLFSCNPAKRIERKCQKWQTICQPASQTDTIFKSDTVIFRDTIIKYHLDRDTVRIEKMIKIPVNRALNIDTLEKLKGIIGVRAGVHNNNLWAEGFVNDSTVFIRLHNALKEIKTLRNEKHSKTIVRHEVRNSSFANFTIWFFWIILILTILFFAIKYFRFF